jgi:hypothetical protein
MPSLVPRSALGTVVPLAKVRRVPRSMWCVPVGSWSFWSSCGRPSTVPVLEVEGGVDADHPLFAEGRRFLEGVAGGAVALPGEDEEEGGDEEGGEFEPVLEGLYEGDAAHAARGDGGDHDGRDDHPAEPLGRSGEHGQRQPGALELGQQVEPADADDEGAREPSYGL